MAYNLACCLGWLYVLVICVRHVADNRSLSMFTTYLRFKFIWCSIDTLWSDVEFTLKIVQTAAVLEVFNSLVGLVKSPWITALMQGISIFGLLRILFWHFISVFPCVDFVGGDERCSNCTEFNFYCVGLHKLGVGWSPQILILCFKSARHCSIPLVVVEIQVLFANTCFLTLKIKLLFAQFVRSSISHWYYRWVGLHVSSWNLSARIWSKRTITLICCCIS